MHQVLLVSEDLGMRKTSPALMTPSATQAGLKMMKTCRAKPFSPDWCPSFSEHSACMCHYAWLFFADCRPGMDGRKNFHLQMMWKWWYHLPRSDIFHRQLSFWPGPCHHATRHGMPPNLSSASSSASSCPRIVHRRSHFLTIHKWSCSHMFLQCFSIKTSTYRRLYHD